MKDLLLNLSPLPPRAGDDALRAQLAFLVEADKLKTIARASPLAAAQRRENSAEHSWHLALMVLILAGHAEQEVDAGHTLKLVVVHDLVEIYAGDSPVHDLTITRDQAQRERQAAEDLFELLPPRQAREVRALWDEFETSSSPEARFAKAIDRLQPLLLNWLARGGTWQTPGVTERDIRRREVEPIHHVPDLGRLADQLVTRARDEGWIRSDPA